ncbi:hypothetical protein KHA80_20575 [Anaerobacillus sp. HL2]|nr:hypothetical protein KHA80_20575 [Anaerobacillus sp. HL2]
MQKLLEKDLRKRRKRWLKLQLYYFAKKGPNDLGGPRGRMISPSDRALAVELIQKQTKMVRD